MNKHIIFEEKEGVAKITLNRPPLNVLNIEMMREINQVLEDLLQRQEKIVVISALGKAFSAGVDVAEHTQDKVEEMIKTFHRIFHLLFSLPCPSLAVVGGAALGGGCELATFCDFVIASEEAKFGQPEIKVGVFPPLAAVTFPKLVGLKKCFELLLVGETVDAQEALSLGLVNRVVPPQKLTEEAERFIESITQKSAAVIRLAKRAVYEALGLKFKEGLAIVEEIYLKELMKTQDAHEGLKAFLEKRPPRWKDK
jgi:cyclohexa-1,5-dienecarbonyl-CoA hydratase